MSHRQRREPLSPIPALPDYVRANQRQWDADSADYETEHGATLARHGGMAWGLWRQPEVEMRALGDLSALVGRDVLELGCGAARWSIALARLGARCTGLDVSAAQLAQARHLMAEAGVDFPLIQASAEMVPLPDASCDLVLSDYGALTYADPARVVTEVGRLLRPGGRAVWCTPTLAVLSLVGIASDTACGPLVLVSGQPPQFILSVRAWRALLARAGSMVLRHTLLRPSRAGAATTFYDAAATQRARHHPLEHLWVVART